MAKKSPSNVTVNPPAATAGLTPRDTKSYTRKSGDRAGKRVRSSSEALLTISLPKDQKQDMRARSIQGGLENVSKLLRRCFEAQEERGWADVPEVQVLLKKKNLLKADGRLVDNIRLLSLEVLKEVEGEE